MKNLFFSKKYLKTKLCLLTVIITVLYHFFNRGNVFVNKIKRNPKGFIIKEKEVKAIYNNSNYNNNSNNNDNNNISNSNNSNYNDNSNDINNNNNNVNNNLNLEIIPSNLVLDYWQSIKESNKSLQIPKISQGINSISKFRKLDFSEFLESQILKDFINFIKSGKYRKDGKGIRWNFAKDLWVYLNISRKGCRLFWDNTVGCIQKKIKQILKLNKNC